MITSAVLSISQTKMILIPCVLSSSAKSGKYWTNCWNFVFWANVGDVKTSTIGWWWCARSDQFELSYQFELWLWVVSRPVTGLIQELIGS